PWAVAMRSWLDPDRPAAWPDGRTECVLDADRVVLPLRVRCVHAGDRFRPLGMRTAKKLGDFFTDEKVPKAERAWVPLIVDDQGVICWIVGHRIDDRVKVTSRTSRHLWLQVEEGTT
ncbi:MAG: tRNA lysidine(34) synthetase TilS, partial [Actinobacteria bacterium]|nr:tRNA lysidine(34) synthetase TilS [Actinomycetota bacterium]